jgi:hypothetical protein
MSIGSCVLVCMYLTGLIICIRNARVCALHVHVGYRAVYVHSSICPYVAFSSLFAFFIFHVCSLSTSFGEIKDIYIKPHRNARNVLHYVRCRGLVLTRDVTRM